MCATLLIYKHKHAKGLLEGATESERGELQLQLVAELQVLKQQPCWFLRWSVNSPLSGEVNKRWEKDCCRPTCSPSFWTGTPSAAERGVKEGAKREREREREGNYICILCIKLSVISLLLNVDVEAIRHATFPTKRTANTFIFLFIHDYILSFSLENRTRHH